MGGRVKKMIELKISCSNTMVITDTMLDYRLFQQFNLLGNGKLNHVTIILTNLPSRQLGKIKYLGDLKRQENSKSLKLQCIEGSYWDYFSLENYMECKGA